MLYLPDYVVNSVRLVTMSSLYLYVVLYQTNVCSTDALHKLVLSMEYLLCAEIVISVYYLV